ncbi:MAG: TIGR01212 family radical SAM protein [Bacteroides sp.]|nr:TIGR01212 family radical SAM protein [Bacteroides sp.]MCM1548521.1 TIGR01212 family radical SAM protein [Clostridium sp.]
MWYNNLSHYLKQEYGMKLYKLALDGGRTCPNRDGTCGTGGCIFCSGEGSGDFAADRNRTVAEQLAQAKERIRPKLPEGPIGYIAYFQAYTNTYGRVEELESMFRHALEDSEVKVLSIATRPDCLSKEILDMLARLQKVKPVWIELGLQTIHEKTAEYIRRGYSLQIYDQAVRNLRQYHITVITHVILGLPGETAEDMLATVEYVGQTRTQGIKLQLLHVLQGTDLETDYRAGRVSVMTLPEYIDILELCIRHLPKEMVIHRLTGDGPKRLLLAPEWSGNKRMVLNTIRREFAKRKVEQGSCFNGFPDD